MPHLIDQSDLDNMTNLVVEYMLSHPKSISIGPSGRYVSVRFSAPIHRIILNPSGKEEVDHINGDGSDNRRRNLRIATSSQNKINQRPRKRGGKQASKYRGVCLHRSRKGDSTTRWRAHINVEGKTLHLGYFKDEERAARSYDAAALQYHGEFAIFNFPPLAKHMTSKHPTYAAEAAEDQDDSHVSGGSNLDSRPPTFASSPSDLGD